MMEGAAEPVVAALMRTEEAPEGVPASVVFTAKAPSATMGRLDTNEVVLNDPKISKVHTRVLLKSYRRKGVTDGLGVLRLFIKDTSTFGTHVNGCKLETCRWTMLAEDDIIGLRHPQCYEDDRCLGEYRVQYRFPPMYLELNLAYLSTSKRGVRDVEGVCTNAAGVKKARVEVSSQDLAAQLQRSIVMQLCPQVGQAVNLVLPDGRLLAGSLCDLSVSALLPEVPEDETTRFESGTMPNPATNGLIEAPPGDFHELATTDGTAQVATDGPADWDADCDADVVASNLTTDCDADAAANGQSETCKLAFDDASNTFDDKVVEPANERPFVDDAAGSAEAKNAASPIKLETVSTHGNATECTLGTEILEAGDAPKKLLEVAAEDV